MNSNMQTLRESSCTSCAVTQDLSAYWTPALYFMHTNGSAELVDEVGGMLAYVFFSWIAPLAHGLELRHC